jgi:ATP-dependent Clp protease ATP-binding subunit ClpA
MRRVIQEQIKRPLADALLFGELAEGGEVRVEVPPKRGAKGGEDKLRLKVKAAKPEPKALPAASEEP